MESLVQSHHRHHITRKKSTDVYKLPPRFTEQIKPDAPHVSIASSGPWTPLENFLALSAITSAHEIGKMDLNKIAYRDGIMSTNGL